MTTMNVLLADLLQRMKPCTHEAMKMYFEALKAPKPSPLDAPLIDEVVSRCVDFLLEHVVALENHDIEMLCHGILIWTKITALVNKAAYLISSLCV